MKAVKVQEQHVRREEVVQKSQRARIPQIPQIVLGNPHLHSSSNNATTHLSHCTLHGTSICVRSFCDFKDICLEEHCFLSYGATSPSVCGCPLSACLHFSAYIQTFSSTLSRANRCKVCNEETVRLFWLIWLTPPFLLTFPCPELSSEILLTLTSSVEQHNSDDEFDCYDGFQDLGQSYS